MRIYHPKARQPYRPRQPRAYIDAAYAIRAVDLSDDGGLYVVERPMPNGGRRRYVRCPCCASTVTCLYLTNSPRMLCRACAQLRYRSQYEGRRPEASWARLERLADRAAKSARQPARHHRLWEQWERASDIWERHREEYHRRYCLMNTLLMVWIQAAHVWIDNLPTDADVRAHHAAYMRAWRAKRRGRILPFPASRPRLLSVMAEAMRLARDVAKVA